MLNLNQYLVLLGAGYRIIKCDYENRYNLSSEEIAIANSLAIKQLCFHQVRLKPDEWLINKCSKTVFVGERVYQQLNEL